MRILLYKLTYALAFILVVSLTASASQQQKPAKRRPPILTTDDVIITPASQPSPESKEAAATPDQPAKAPDSAEPKPAQPKATEVKVSDEESSWRERLGQAQTRAKEAERAAEEGELRITHLRNELGASGHNPRYRNETAAALDQAGQRLSELRAKARTAAADAAQLVEYGRQRGFTEADGPKPTSDEGKPNEEYYRTQFAKLTDALESAQRRVQLYDNRVRDLNQQIATNSGGRDSSGRSTGGDSFFALQLQKDRDEAQKQLDQARTAQTQAQNDIDALKEEARRAGVPPGLFR